MTSPDPRAPSPSSTLEAAPALRVPAWRRGARWLRPSEWVVVAFVAFVAARAGPRAFGSWDVIVNHRSFDVLVALLTVVTVHLAFRSREARWPEELAGRRWIWMCAAPVAALPLLGAVVVSVLDLARSLPQTEGPKAFAVLRVQAFLVTTLAVGTPPLALWWAVGLHLRRPGSSAFGAAARQLALDSLAALRDWAPVLLLISGYAWMERVIGYPSVTRDAWMDAADRWLFFGHDPVESLQAIVARPLSELMALAYSSYALLFMVCLGGVFMAGGRRALREVGFAVSAALAIGYVAYAFIPVRGPVFHRSFAVPLDFYIVGDVKDALMDRNRILFDCFPSLHTAVTMIFGWGCFRHARPVFWATLPLVVLTPMACVYLRYHYVVDCLAGAVLAVALMLATPRLFPREAPAAR